jgi:hypothetical protein
LTIGLTGFTPSKKKGMMKTIKLNIKNASAGQMLTLRGELRVMANNWKRFGPVIEVQAGKLQEPKLTSHKRSITKW